MKLRYCLLCITILIAFLPVHAWAEDQAVTVNDISEKRGGDAVRISGRSSYDEVIVKVMKPDQTVLIFEMVDVEDGSYSATFSLPVDAPAGQYVVVAGNSTDVASDKFAVTESSYKPKPRADSADDANGSAAAAFLLRFLKHPQFLE